MKRKRISKGFYMRLLIFIFILSTLPVLLVGIFSYIKAANTVHENVSKEKLQSIYQTQANIEQTLKTVDHSLNHFVSSSFLKETLREPLTVHQFQRYNLVKQDLNHLQTFDTQLSDIYLLSMENKWLINNSGLHRLSEEQLDEFFSKYFELPFTSIWLLEDDTFRVYNLNRESKDRYCTSQVNLVKQLPLTSINKGGLAIASIPTCSLASEFKTINDNETLMILDSNSQVIAHNDFTEIGSDYSKEAYMNRIQDSPSATGQFNITLEDTDYTVTYRKSDYNNWIYLSLISYKDFSQQSTSIGLFTAYVCLSVLGISLIYSWLGSRHFYKPIRNIYDLIMSTFQPKEELKKQNEFDLIEQQIHHILDQNKELEDKLQGQISQLKQFFMIKLLQGSLSKKEIETRVVSYGYNNMWNKLIVLALQIDTLEGSKYKKEEIDLLLFTINNIVEGIIAEERRLTPIAINKTQVTIILCDSDSEEECEHRLNELTLCIQQKVKEELQLPVSIGISLPYQELCHTSIAFKESLEALKYRIKFGNESVIFFENLERGQSFHTFYPQNVENELFDSIKLGEREKAEKKIKELVQVIFSKDLNPNQYQISLVRLLNNLILLMQTLGTELVRLDDNKSLFDQLFEFKSPEAIEEWFKDLIILPLITTLEERTKSQYKNISDKIVHIIVSEYDTDITLEHIAARMHYNPNYLSSIFRKETNISFSEYLTLYRHNKAKEWLLDTAMSIKEISEKLRYTNSQNFIRSFKKNEGITPGKFREAHRK